MTDTTEIPAPLAIKGATDLLSQHGTDRDILRALAWEAGHLHASYAAVEAAQALRTLLGADAHRAVFERVEDVEGGVSATLLAVFDSADRLIWFNRDTNMLGSELSLSRLLGDPMPEIERETLRYIEGLIEWAEEAHHDGHLLNCQLTSEPSLGTTSGEWPEATVELRIDDEIGSLERAIGAPAYDGSTGPQRKLLSPEIRDVAALALQRVLDGQQQIMMRVTLTKKEKKLVREAIAALTPRKTKKGNRT